MDMASNSWLGKTWIHKKKLSSINSAKNIGLLGNGICIAVNQLRAEVRVGHNIENLNYIFEQASVISYYL